MIWFLLFNIFFNFYITSMLVFHQNIPCQVFQIFHHDNNLKYIAECCSEIIHSRENAIRIVHTYRATLTFIFPINVLDKH